MKNLMTVASALVLGLSVSVPMTTAVAQTPEDFVFQVSEEDTATPEAREAMRNRLQRETGRYCRTWADAEGSSSAQAQCQRYLTDQVEEHIGNSATSE